MKRRQKILSSFMVICLLFQLLPITGLAAETAGTDEVSNAPVMELEGESGAALDAEEPSEALADPAVELPEEAGAVTDPASTDAVAVAAEDIVASGTCAANDGVSDLRWQLDSNGVLTILGSGDMANYTSYNLAPWYDYRASIYSIAMNVYATSVGSYAFYQCENLTRVNLSRNITRIGAYAFANCTKLQIQTGELPGTIEIIGTGAFSNCQALSVMKLPSSLTTIGDNAFEKCNHMTEVDIPDSVTTLGSSAFLECNALQSINIPGQIGRIGDSTFYNCTSLVKATIAESVTSIGMNAFYGCSKLSNLTMPATASLGQGAFSGCIKIATVTLTGTGPMASYDTSSSTYTPWYNSNDSVEVTIKSGITDIGQCAFYECRTLAKIAMPDTVTCINANAFYNCDGLTSVDIPASVTTIHENAFRECNILSTVNILGDISSIGRYAFAECTWLGSINLSGSVSSIGEYAFSGCTSLWSIDLSNSAVSIGNYAFSGCTSLYQANLSSNVISIGAYAFNGCNNLQEAILSDTITSIGNNAFQNCSALAEVKLPNNPQYKKINEYTFENCTNLQKIDIPACVEGIDTYAFSECANLRNVTIPLSVKDVNIYAFNNCSRIDDVHYLGTEEQWKDADTIYIAPTGNDYLLNAENIHFENPIHTVTFDPNGGEMNGQPESKEVTNGEQYGLLPAPVRERYLFLGWYDAVDGGSKVETTTIVQLSADQTLYAHWEHDPNFTITFDPNGGNMQPESKVVTNGKPYGSLPSPVQENYRFLGWYDALEGGSKVEPTTIVQLSADQTLYAHWEQKRPVTITFNVNGGNLQPDPKIVNNGDPYGELPYSAYGHGENKVLEGWYTAAEGGDRIYASTIVDVEGDTQVLYAHWLEYVPNIPPSVSTKEAENIGKTSAVIAGVVDDEGSGSVINRQLVYWDKYDASSRYVVDVGEEFSCTINNLSPSTTYYYYAKAVNKYGDGVGKTLSFTTEADEDPVSITVSPTFLSLEVGGTYQLLATVLPADARNREVVWSSSDTGTVSVDAVTGQLKASSEGRATITATTRANGLTATCTVEVIDRPSDPKGEFDFSEWNMASHTATTAENNNGYDYEINGGGNFLMSTAYLSRWEGAVLEENDPYPGFYNYTTNPSDYHVQEVLWLPTRADGDPLDNSEIKTAIMTYGAVYESFIVDWDCFDSDQKNYYYPESNTNSAGGHAITVVGWDDNYPAANFKTTPPGNGAFICKNSWGTGSGEDGYFYISYYDKFFGRRNGGAVVPAIESNTNYNKIYQYDPLGACSALGTSMDTMFAANVFPENGNKLGNDEELKAVSFYTYDKNTSYEVYVVKEYTDRFSLQEKGPALASGCFKDRGYHTVVLNSPVTLNAGTRFAVMVKLTVNGGEAAVYYEYPIAGFSSRARANVDESYYSVDGSEWKDLTERINNANFCIKAFTANGYEMYSRRLYSGIDNENRAYESDKVYTLEEALEAGIPINEEYIKWAQQADYAEGSEDAPEGGESVLGDILMLAPAGSNSISFVDGAMLPSKYDLREQRGVTPVRDQGNWGTCWTFATYGSLESCLMKKAQTLSSATIDNMGGIVDALTSVGQSGNPVDYIWFAEPSGSMDVNADIFQLAPNLRFEPEDATNTSVKWSSADERIATVDTKGAVTTHAAGTTTITATLEQPGREPLEAVYTLTVIGVNVGTDIEIRSISAPLTEDKTVTVTLDNNGSTLKTLKVFVAFYDINGKMLVIGDTMNVQIEANRTGEEIPVAFAELPSVSDYKVKCFVLDTNNQPVTASKEA